MYGLDVIYGDDPYIACHYGYFDHPHYHDCHNCKYGVHCDTGKVLLELEETQKALAQVKALAASCKPKVRPLPP